MCCFTPPGTGEHGKAAAFIAELTISFLLMVTALFVSNHSDLARYTPYVVGILVATFKITETMNWHINR